MVEKDRHELELYQQQQQLLLQQQLQEENEQNIHEQIEIGK